jgi:hypothetical protein
MPDVSMELVDRRRTGVLVGRDPVVEQATELNVSLTAERKNQNAAKDCGPCGWGSTSRPRSAAHRSCSMGTSTRESPTVKKPWRRMLRTHAGITLGAKNLLWYVRGGSYA